MEMEGRGFSELHGNTAEEIFIKSMMDNPIGNPAPSMEMLGFKNIMQPFRADSEELFNSWLMNGESPASSITQRTHQASTRIAADLGLSPLNAGSFAKKSSDVYTSYQNFIPSDEHLSHPGQYCLRNSAEDGIQASKLHLAKAGFPQPLIRSRSSELRRKYDDMQNHQIKVVSQAPHNIPAHGIYRFDENFTNLPMAEMPNQLQKFIFPSTSSTPYNPPIPTANTISQKDASDISSIQNVGNQTTVFHILSPSYGPNSHNLATMEKSLDCSMKGFPTEANRIQMSTISQEPSRSDSSTATPATPALSAGFEVCDGGAQSGKYVGKDKVGKEESTKKRRVERSRKMAEAKERNSTTPSLSSDMQEILKRWENLEKEVRSLKLNLSFMNRKDSEQTKLIEELQKQNEQLTEEKERLLEEIDQNIS